MKLKSLIFEEDTSPDTLHLALKSGTNKFESSLQQVSQEIQRKVSNKQKVKDFLIANPDVKSLVGSSIQVNEELDGTQIMSIVGFMMSIPTLISLIGVVVDHIEKKIGLSKKDIGVNLEKLGHTIHDDLVKSIRNGLEYLPGFKRLPSSIREKISSIIYIIIVISLSIGSGGLSISSAIDVFPDMIKGSAELSKSGLTNITNLINSIKGGEAGSIIKDMLIQLLKT